MELEHDTGAKGSNGVNYSSTSAIYHQLYDDEAVSGSAKVRCQEIMLHDYYSKQKVTFKFEKEINVN